MTKNLVLFFSVILISCNSVEQKAIEENAQSQFLTAKTDTTLVLDFIEKNPFFHKYGAGDFFTYDTTEIISKKFIFISDLEDSAVFRLNGENVFLIIDSSQTISRQKDNSWQKVWKNNSYQVILRGKANKDKDESIYSKGTLEILTPRSKSVLSVHGDTDV